MIPAVERQAGPPPALLALWASKQCSLGSPIGETPYLPQRIENGLLKSSEKVSRNGGFFFVICPRKNSPISYTFGYDKHQTLGFVW